MQLCLMVASVLLKIKFGYAQISVPKIGIPMSHAAVCVNAVAVVKPFLSVSIYF